MFGPRALANVGLGEQQQTQIQQLRAAFHERNAELLSQLHASHQNLNMLWTGPELNEQQILAAQAELSALRQTLDRERALRDVQIGRVLSDTQRKQSLRRRHPHPPPRPRRPSHNGAYGEPGAHSR